MERHWPITFIKDFRMGLMQSSSFVVIVVWFASKQNSTNNGCGTRYQKSAVSQIGKIKIGSVQFIYMNRLVIVLCAMSTNVAGNADENECKGW